MDTSTILQILDNYSNGGFQTYPGYAEPGYDEDCQVATGNWNSSRETRRRWPNKFPDFLTPPKVGADAVDEYTDNTMPRIAAILEKLWVKMEWEDEWASCDGCYKLVRTQPDSYSWTPSYWMDDCGLYCEACVLDDPEGYLKYLDGNPEVANTLNLDLEPHGYRKIDADFENGLYGGQSDDPEVIADSLRELGVERFIFDIDGVGQFDCDFSVWVHESEWEKTVSWLDPTEIESKGADPAVAMQAALRRT